MEIKRKMASIQLVNNLIPIEGKDRIESAEILGWHVIVRKGDFAVGDKCLFVEPDALLPKSAIFGEMGGKRIKVMRMADVYSEGFAIPLPKSLGEREVGEDVSEELGVYKYCEVMEKEKPQPKPQSSSSLFSSIKRYFDKKWSEFPSFISKTDEPRIQTMPWLLTNKQPFTVTEKIDGCSFTVAVRRHLFGLVSEWYQCSRNKRLPNDDNSHYGEVVNEYHLRDVVNRMARKMGAKSVIVQGEIIGPKIQGNPYHVSHNCFFVFNLIVDGVRLPSVSARDIVEQYGLEFVPIVASKYTLPDTVEKMLAYATGYSCLGEYRREGVVVRSCDGSISFKAVSPAYLTHKHEVVYD